VRRSKRRHPERTKRGAAVDANSAEGLNVNADVSVSFRVDPVRAPRLYAKCRQADLEVFAHGLLRNQVKDAINDRS
jgi:hypothetical protein